MKNKLICQCCFVCFILTLLMSNAYGVSLLSTKLETDSDGNGTIDSVLYSIYDDCALVEMRADNNADSVIDSITYTEYNVGKYSTIVRHDLDADGQIDRILYMWEENNGNEKKSITEEDSNADGTIDSFSCFLYIDNNSSAISRVYKGSGSYSGGGTLTSITYYTNDANGKTIKEESDDDADGVIDAVEYISYNQNCLPVLHETDLENDGDIDQTLQSSYDGKCRPVRTELDSNLVSIGIEVVSNHIYEMEYTDDIYGAPVKIETHATLTQTIMGQTVVEESTVIQYMTYEYGAGDCGPTTLCTGCSNSDSDSDNDGLTDSVENSGCTSAQDTDTDDDGIADGVEDANQNGLVDSGETDPCSVDSDGDGIQDGTELGYTLAMVDSDTDLNIFVYDADPLTTTNALLADTDGDGLSDGEEDANQNGRVDTGENDPGVEDNVSASSLLPAVNLLLLN